MDVTGNDWVDVTGSDRIDVIGRVDVAGGDCSIVVVLS